MHNHHDIRNVPGQFAQAFRHFSDLVQGELKLARAEMSQNLSRAGFGVAFFGIAALLALVALHILASALVAWIATTGISPALSAALVGGALLIAAVVLVIMGKSRLSADALKPTKTIAAVERDFQQFKEASNV